MTKKFVEKVRRDMNRINQTGFGFSIISDDYSSHIFDLIQDEVAEDIKECAAERYNDDDVRLAVGRVLVKRLGIEI